jgi:hypothetical protein
MDKRLLGEPGTRSELLIFSSDYQANGNGPETLALDDRLVSGFSCSNDDESGQK